MKLEGKKIAFLGDSITEGFGVEKKEKRYDNVIKKNCKLKQVFNYGISGTRIAHQMKASEKPRYDLCFCGRAYDLNVDTDIIVVFGGTNDYGHGDAPFGNKKGRTPDTYCGAVDFLMRLLKQEYIGKTIVFITPTRRMGDESVSKDIYKKSDARPLKDYVQVILEKGKEYQIPVLNLFEKLGLNPELEEVRTMYMPDGLHFNDAGHQLIAEQLIAFLQEL